MYIEFSLTTKDSRERGEINQRGLFQEQLLLIKISLEIVQYIKLITSFI